MHESLKGILFNIQFRRKAKVFFIKTYLFALVLKISNKNKKQWSERNCV